MEKLGGAMQSDPEKEFDLLESMPGEVREQLQWRMKLPEPYEGLKDIIYATTGDIMYHRHPGSTLNVFDEGKDEQGNFVGKAAPPEQVEVFEEQMLAFMKKMGFKAGAGGGRGAAGGGGGRVPAPAGGGRPGAPQD